MPQSILSYSPTDAVTTTVTIVPVATATYEGRPIYCGLGVALIPYTGSVRIDFRTSYSAMDFYILTGYQLNSYLASMMFAIPCAPPSEGEYVFGQSGVGIRHFDVNLPSGALYYILLIQCCGNPVANSVATITINGIPLSVTATPTSRQTTHQPISTLYTTTSTTTTTYPTQTRTTSYAETYPTPATPEAPTTAPFLISNMTGWIVLGIISIAAIALAVLLFALFRESRRRKATRTAIVTPKTKVAKKRAADQFCISCGARLPPRSKFCNKCGTKQP